MVQQSNVQADRGIRDSGNRYRQFLLRSAAWFRKPLVAYVVIAFAISFSFHELEHHTDRQLGKALYLTCLRNNDVRTQFNEQLLVLESETSPHKTRVRLLKLADCSRVPRP
jgi:hypothetical protein